MTSSGNLRIVALVRSDVSEQLSTSIFRVTTFDQLGSLAVTIRSLHRLLVTANGVYSSQILVTLMMEAIGSSQNFWVLQGPHGVTFQKTAFLLVSLPFANEQHSSSMV
jgi:hypothetical protein